MRRKCIRVSELNVQNQQKIEWPRHLVVAKAYLDQLERSKGLGADQIAQIRQAIKEAESSKMNSKDKEKLEGLAASVNKNVAQAKNAADAARMQSLADILKRPVA